MSNSEHQSTSESKTSLEETIAELAKNVQNLMDRVGQIEASQRETINHEGDNMLRQHNFGYFNRAPNFEPDHYNHNGPRDFDDRMFKDKIDAPTFDGCLDPWVFTDWLRQMEKFFDYYHWAENKKVRYARMKLIGRADLFWEDLEETLRRRREPPITDWLEMKNALSRNYLPSTYRSSLLEEWDRLRQGNTPVAEYIEKFMEFKRRIQIVEEEVVTLNRFKKGLNASLLGEIITRGVTTLREAYELARNCELASKSIFWRRSEPRSVPTNPQPFGSRPRLALPPKVNPNSTPIEKEDKGKGVVNEPSRLGSRLQCFKCNGVGHIAARCPSRALVIQEGDEKVEDVEELVYDPNVEGTQDVEAEWEDDPSYLACIRAISPQVDDFKDFGVPRVNVVIIDSGSYINAVSSNVVSRLGLKLTPHPNPYRVSWVDTSSIAIKERYVVPLQFLTYKAEIWCDVIPMDVGHIILGRTWLYDLDVTLYGRSNSYSFMFEGKKIVLNPLKPKPINMSKKKEAPKAKDLSIISPKAFEKVAIQESIVFVLVAREVHGETCEEQPEEVKLVLQEFKDVFPEELPDHLPPMRDIQHAIDFVPGATLPNLPHYRMSPTEHAELQRQVEELLRKGFVHESMSPCAVPALLTPKKDGTWRMCVNSCAINKITVKYRFPIPRLDDMLDMIAGATIFSKIDLKSSYHQIRVRSGDEWKTAVKTKDGLYKWMVMPFGLSNAPSTFMRVMTQVLKPFMGKFLVVYFDDILIYSKSREQHLDHLTQVCTTLRKESLYGNLKKCSFFTDKVVFLGFIVSSEGVSADPKRFKQLWSGPRPRISMKFEVFMGSLPFTVDSLRGLVPSCPPSLTA
nr:uncharacterized protein LOC112012220 [Quercus suber]